ncbi:ZIP family metal transporter [Leptolyngbya sp. AN03gr2]|uniref:ZIP family metal transporter n=1 Tax=unclassified Leptolyngbya TaxID=2650499 RepID=UPI003D314BC6
MADNVTLLGLAGSLVAGLATGAGALPIFFIKEITPQTQGALLGFGAGVMLAATSFSLVIPGIEAAEKLTQNQLSAASIVVLGILLGGAFLWLANRYFPHEHFIKGAEGSNASRLRQVWLFVIAITLHNFPEGLAVGVGFGGGDVANGIALTVGIGLQNFPEGLVVAIALLAQGYRRRNVFGVALLTGLAEPIGGVIGAGVVSVASIVLPWGMAFAAGAMLFVISDEIIPESHSLGTEKQATLGVMIGFVLMLFLDVTLG